MSHLNLLRRRKAHSILTEILIVSIFGAINIGQFD